MSKVLMVASTPFQLFNAIHIRETVLERKNVDMYVLNIGSVAEQLYMNICDKDIFNNVYLINVGITNYAKKAVYYLNRIYKLFMGKKLLVGEIDDYEAVWIVGTEVFSKIIFYNLYKENKKIKLYFYEEGIGTYINILTESHDKWRHRVLKYLYGFDLFSVCEKCYVYQKTLVHNMWDNIEICTIPKIDKEQKTLLFDVFKIEEDDRYSNMIKQQIFFTSNDVRYCNEQKEIIEEISKINKNVLLKIHPNQTEEYDDCNLIKISGNGIEFINLFHDLSQSTLISYLSTACLTPKMIFGEEPRLIMLYKLLPDYKKYQPLFHELLLEIQALYKDKDRIIVPHSYEEFIDLMGNDDIYEEKHN